MPTPESLLLPLPSQNTTQLSTRKKSAAKVQATSQSSMLSLERSDAALAAEARMQSASGLPLRSEGPASTGTSNKQAQPDSYVSTRPVKRQNRRNTPSRFPAGSGFLRASELVPWNGGKHAAGLQSVHGCAPVRYAASTGELQGVSLAAPASVGVKGVKDGSRRAGWSQEQRHPAAIQHQTRDQLGVFADCDSDDEDLALQCDLLEEQAAVGPGTCRHVATGSQYLPADPISLQTIGVCSLSLL